MIIILESVQFFVRLKINKNIFVSWGVRYKDCKDLEKENQIGFFFFNNGVETWPFVGNSYPSAFFFYFIQCQAWGKVFESVSRQARLQRALRQRLRNPWTQLKSQIVVFNQVEFQHVAVLPKITWGLVLRPKSAIFSFSACGCMYVCMLSFFSSMLFSRPFNRLK